MCIYIYTKLYNCVYTYLYMYNIGWWFGTFFIFPFIGNNHHPNWLSYFSAGLKPPTRIYIYTYPIVRLCNPWIFSQAGPAELHDDAPWLNSKVGPVALGDYCDMGMVLSPEIWMWTFIIFGICFIHNSSINGINGQCFHIYVSLSQVTHEMSQPIHLRDRCPGWSRQPGPNHHPQPIGYPANQWPKMHRSHANLVLELGGW